ncbi:STAS domain-containing protein [Streptomyces sp. NPDC006733]|uniref:STAS domain-containing protein n=1 Tax=Streptomyces sp. NPDC006733 TaxID=3155460 RepID=UPI0034021678
MTRLQVRPVHHDQGDAHVLALVGELDLDSEDVLASAVDVVLRARQDGPARRSRLVLDCGGLTFCDSRGLGLLLTIRQKLEDAGDVLVLADPTPQLLRTLELTGADQVLTLVDGVSEAVLPASPREPLTGESGG